MLQCWLCLVGGCPAGVATQAISVSRLLDACTALLLPSSVPPVPLPAGGMSKNYIQIKKLMFTQPEVLHALLQKLADAIVTYIKYQVGGGWGGRCPSFAKCGQV